MIVGIIFAVILTAISAACTMLLRLPEDLFELALCIIHLAVVVLLWTGTVCLWWWLLWS